MIWTILFIMSCNSCIAHAGFVTKSRSTHIKTGKGIKHVSVGQLCVDIAQFRIISSMAKVNLEFLYSKKYIFYAHSRNPENPAGVSKLSSPSNAGYGGHVALIR